MGKTKKTMDGLRVAHMCWTAPDPGIAHNQADCERLGCPYAHSPECSSAALVDAVELAEKLWHRLKREKANRHHVDPHK